MENSENFILNTKLVEEIMHKEKMGVKIKRHEKLWLSNLRGIRRPNLTFAMTDEELQEYFKCKMSCQYFAQKYCYIKREDGSIGPMTLRDYQKDIIDLYTNNRFSILMASRQVGKCSLFDTKVIIYSNGNEKEISLGELYFETIKNERKLTFLEKIKYFLYKLYIKL